MTVFDRLVSLFQNENAKFRVIEHQPEGRSDVVVCAIPIDGRLRFVLAVVPGDRRVDIKAVARVVGGKKGGFAQAAQAQELTCCPIGAIPPVVFDDALKLVVDKQFLERESEIAFNAGRLDRSIVINTADYVRIVRPATAAIATYS